MLERAGSAALGSRWSIEKLIEDHGADFKADYAAWLKEQVEKDEVLILDEVRLFGAKGAPEFLVKPSHDVGTMTSDASREEMVDHNHGGKIEFNCAGDVIISPDERTLDKLAHGATRLDNFRVEVDGHKFLVIPKDNHAQQAADWAEHGAEGLYSGGRQALNTYKDFNPLEALKDYLVRAQQFNVLGEVSVNTQQLVFENLIKIIQNKNAVAVASGLSTIEKIIPQLPERIKSEAESFFENIKERASKEPDKQLGDAVNLMKCIAPDISAETLKEALISEHSPIEYKAVSEESIRSEVENAKATQQDGAFFEKAAESRLEHIQATAQEAANLGADAKPQALASSRSAGAHAYLSSLRDELASHVPLERLAQGMDNVQIAALGAHHARRSAQRDGTASRGERALFSQRLAGNVVESGAMAR